MGTVLVGLGEFAIAETPGDMLRTFGLGSCVAIIAMHSASGIIGMAHIVLPDSTTNRQKAIEQPGYFADTAIPALFERLDQKTARGRYVVKLVGGAAVLKTVPASDKIDIGKRNVIATKKGLWQRGLGAIAEETGGDQSRSVCVSVGSPRVEIKHGNVLLRVL